MSSIHSVRPLSSNIGLLNLQSVFTIDKKWAVRGKLSVNSVPERRAGSESWPTLATFETEETAWNFMVTFADEWARLEYVQP